MRKTVLTFLVFAAAQTAGAQITDPGTTQKNSPLPQTDFDTVRTTTPDTTITDSINNQTILKSNLRSPGGALRRSLLIPGWGQIYNKKPFKAVVIAGGQGVLLGTALAEWKRASDAKKDLDLANYRVHTNNRNLFLWLYAGATVFSMLDAYIDAHLSQDTGEGVPEIGNFWLEPDAQNQAVLLKFKLNF
jgi:hypothetical protein